MAERCYVHHIGISRIYKDPADDVRFSQADEFPGFAAIGGLVRSFASEHSIARSGIARSHVNNLGIRWRDGHCTDIVALEIFVRNVLPAMAIIFALPRAGAR